MQAGTQPALPEAVRRPSRLQALAALEANVETSTDALDRIAGHGLPAAGRAGRAGQPGRRRSPAVRGLRRGRARVVVGARDAAHARLLPVRPRGGRGVRVRRRARQPGAGRQSGRRAAGRDRLRRRAAARRQRRADRDAVRDRPTSAHEWSAARPRDPLRSRRQRGRRAAAARRERGARPGSRRRVRTLGGAELARSRRPTLARERDRPARAGDRGHRRERRLAARARRVRRTRCAPPRRPAPMRRSSRATTCFRSTPSRRSPR